MRFNHSRRAVALLRHALCHHIYSRITPVALREKGGGVPLAPRGHYIYFCGLLCSLQ